MLDELGENALQLTLVSDEQPVEAFTTRGANEPLGERVGTRRSRRCLDDARANRSHHFIEGPNELGISVSDQEPDGAALVLDGHGEVARLLGDPAADRMLGNTGQEDLAAFEVDEKQHVETTEHDCVDVEEVARQRAGRLSSKELSPRRSRSSRRRFQAMTSQHIVHARRRDGDAELPQLADDAEIAPPRILPRETKDDGHDLGIERIGSDRLRSREGPISANELTVPAHKRCRRDEESGPPLTRKKSSECREHGAISGENCGRATWRRRTASL